MYFEQMPTINYLLTPAGAQSGNNFITLTDITKNVRFKKEVIDNIVLFDYYHLRDGETMEQVSEKVYGTPHNHWVLMLLNDRFDWRSDMPMNSRQFDSYLIEKYGSIENARATVAFYRNEAGQAVSATSPSSSMQEDPAKPGTFHFTGTVNNTAVTAYDMETLLNEEKRRIKVISPAVMATVLKNYRDLTA